MNNYEIIMTEYRNILNEIDDEWHRLARRYNFSCERCGDCCRGPVPVSRYFEARLLGEHFDRLDQAKQRKILWKSRLYKREAKRRGYPTYPSMPLFGAEVVLRQAECDLRGIACPLLSDENLCQLYEARPFACRTYICYDERVDWTRFHKRINELERRADLINWNTQFVPDVLLLAEKPKV
jgi:Fe-S-cluster containining protein